MEIKNFHNGNVFINNNRILGSDSRQGELLAYRYSLEQSSEAQKRLRYMTLRYLITFMASLCIHTNVIKIFDTKIFSANI